MSPAASTASGPARCRRTGPKTGGLGFGRDRGFAAQFAIVAGLDDLHAASRAISALRALVGGLGRGEAALFFGTLLGQPLFFLGLGLGFSSSRRSSAALARRSCVPRQPFRARSCALRRPSARPCDLRRPCLSDPAFLVGLGLGGALRRLGLGGELLLLLRLCLGRGFLLLLFLGRCLAASFFSFSALAASAFLAFASAASFFFFLSAAASSLVAATVTTSVVCSAAGSAGLR